MKPDNVGEYAEAIRERKLRWLYGYPSLLAFLASQIMDQNIARPEDVQVATTSSESLAPRQREIIAKAFGAQVREHYCQAEAVANVSECRNGKLHVNEDFSLVEFIPLDEQRGLHRVVGTSWTNLAFPLFRYDTGDIVRLGAHCECGHAGRVVTEIDGRVEDFITLSDGKKLGH